MVYYKQRQSEKAVIDFTADIKLEIDFAYKWMADIFIDVEEREKAIAALDKSIEIKPEYNNFYLRGWSYLTIHEFKNALADFSKLLEIDQTEFDRYYNRGWLYYEIGDFHNMVADFNQLVKFPPQDRRFYADRGCAYQIMGLYNNTLDDYNTAISMGNYELALRKGNY